MSDLVERVARVIHMTTWDGDPSDTFDETYESNQKRAREQARAAIAAVRAWDVETGPSEAEIQASFHERGTFFRGEVRGILRAAAVERARGEVG